MNKIQALRILANANQDLINNGRISEDIHDQLFELIETFQGQTLTEISKYFEDDLTSDDVKVFFNFYKNIEAFKKIALELQTDTKLSKATLKSYFVSKHVIDKSLFTEAYREALNHVQTTGTQKIKVEMYMDLHQYFKHGCYSADFNDNNVLPSKIIEASLKRNIGVKIIHDRNNDGLTIEFIEESLNKYGLTKPGLLDSVKLTPNGLVIGFATADGLIKSEDEAMQLEAHLAALEQGILQNKFNQNYAFNTYHIKERFDIKTLDEIIEINFYSLAKLYSGDAQKHVELLGFHKESLEFIRKCYKSVLESTRINPDLKSKINLEGILHSSIKQQDLADIGVYLLAEVKKTCNKAHLLEKNAKHDVIKSYMTSLCKTIIELDGFTSSKTSSQMLTLLNKHTGLIETIVGPTLHTKLFRCLSSTNREHELAEIKHNIANAYKEHLVYQSKIFDQWYTAVENIKHILESKYHIDSDEIIHKVLVSDYNIKRFKPEELLYILTDRTWISDCKKSFGLDVRQRLRMQQPLSPELETILQQLNELNPGVNSIKPLDLIESDVANISESCDL